MASSERVQQPANRRTFDPKSTALIYVHIPKAAGMTLERILFRQYRWREIYHSSSPEHLARIMSLPREKRLQYKLFVGHLPFGLQRLLEQSAATITMLRNPVDLALSCYFFFELDYRRSVLGEEVDSSTLSVSDLESAQMRAMFDNLQTRYLSANVNVEYGGCTREMLELAKQNLEECVVLGLVEKFDESVVMMSKALGWRMPFYVKTNVNRARPRNNGIGREVIDWLTERNRFDLELYDYAHALFRRQAEAFGDGLGVQVERYREQNKKYGYFFDLFSRAKRKVGKVPLAGALI